MARFPPKPKQPTKKQRFSVDEAAHILGISPAHVYRRIQRGELRAVKDGARTLITQQELDRYSRTTQESA